MARTRGSGQPAAERAETSLDAAMRAPSTTTPEVVVLDYVEEEVKVKEVVDPRRDLYLSTVDGSVSPFVGATQALLCKSYQSLRRLSCSLYQFSKLQSFNFPFVFLKYIANRKLSRYSSPIIPVRVGPHAETFPVHKDILTKSEYFRKALDGEFREAGDQAIDLPEEDPDIFSFVIAYLYEEKFVPIKPMAMALGRQSFL
jgi:hypothetical protein